MRPLLSPTRTSFLTEHRRLRDELIDLGQALQAPEFDAPKVAAHPDANNDYTSALDRYEHARQLLDRARNARSLLDAAVAVADGKFLVASARARLAGKDPRTLDRPPPLPFSARSMRYGATTILFIAAVVTVAVVSFFVGVVVAGGWEDPGTKAEEQAARPQGDASEWNLAPMSADRMCARGPASVNVHPVTTPEPVRLSDHVADRSPVERFTEGTEGPIGPPWTNERPWLYDALVKNRAVTGYAGGFNEGAGPGADPGGFGITVYEFRSLPAAVNTARHSFVDLVCEYGADPYRVEDRPEVLVAVQDGAATTISWVHGDRLIEINYAMYGDPADDRNEALLVAEETWALGQE